MIRVMMVADGGWPTGFERVARGIGTYLQATGKYEVIHRGLGYSDAKQSRVLPYPYEIKPVLRSPKDPLGVMAIPDILAEDKPDAVIYIQDIWNQANYLGYTPRELPTIGYYPVDTPNLKWSYAMAAGALTEAVPYTAFGAQETALGVREAVDIVVGSKDATARAKMATWITLPHEEMQLHMRLDRLAARQDVRGYRPVPHGVDTSLFGPVSKKEARKAFGLPEDAFVVLNVNTNQFRKRQDLSIRAFARFAATHDNAVLLLHSASGFEREGWDLTQLATLYGVQDRVVCVHHYKPHLTDEELNLLYNTADVQMNTGGGEGWGLTTVDGALCGVPQMVPDWSATREIWKDTGVLLPVSDYRFEPKYLNTAHAIVDVEQCANRLAYLADNPDVRAAIGAACRERALALPTWDEVGKQFSARVASALMAPPPTPMTLDQLYAARTEVLRSELLEFDTRQVSR